MINRSNNYISVDKEQLKKTNSNKGKRVLVTVGGIVLTLSLLTGCGKGKENEEVDLSQIDDTSIEIIAGDIGDIDLSSFEIGLKKIRIVGTNLTDVSELSNYSNLSSVNLSDNLLTDVSALEELSDISFLYLSNNSISSINLSSFPNLRILRIGGNYNLYTDSLIDYCEKNEIWVDITREDVKNVQELRKIVKGLNLEGLTDLQKERVIYQYVLDHLEYDEEALKDHDLCVEYNINDLKHALNGKGVCVNYATMFDAMCELAGINCYTITGEARGEGHGWNLVEIDGEYMLCDATWSDSLIASDLLTFIYEKTSVNLDVFYNRTGKLAEKFIKNHSEIDPLVKLEDGEITNVRNDMAIESEDKSREESESIGDKIFSKVDGVIHSIDFSGVDMKKVMSVVLAGIGAGSVILLSKQAKKSIKKKVEKMKLERQKKERNKQQRKEQNNRNKEKQNIPKNEPVKKVNVVEHFSEEKIEKVVVPPIKETKKEEKRTFRTLDEKIEFLVSKASSILRSAAEMQVDLEIYHKLIEIYFREEKITSAMNELLSLVGKSDDEKALVRSHRVGYLNDVSSFDNLSILQRDALDASKRMYSDVDKRMNQYLEIYKLLDEINKTISDKTVSEEDIDRLIRFLESDKSIIDDNNKRMGYVKINLLMILTFIVSLFIAFFCVSLGK